MSNRHTWEDNAAEFGALSKQGTDLRLAALVACSVEKGNGQGRRQPRREHDEVKVSAKEFGRRADTTADRVLRHLVAWQTLADQGLVMDPPNLAPGDVNADALFLASVDACREKFAEVYDASDAGSRPRAPISEIDGALAKQTGYAARLVDGLSDAGFAALVEAVDAAVHAEAEPDPDLPPAPPAPPTTKRKIVDDWADRKAKRDAEARQAELDAKLEAARLEALARGGKVPSEPDPVPDQFGDDFGAWAAIEQRVTELLTEVQIKRDQYGISDYEMGRVQEWAVNLLDVAAGRSRVSGLGQVVQS